MKYREIADGIFVDRPNRFIAHVEVNGAVETVHVKNTGRFRLPPEKPSSSKTKCALPMMTFLPSTMLEMPWATMYCT